MHIDLRGSRFHLLAGRALFWEKEKALICSDLHWGRELLLQKYGMPVPNVSFEQDAWMLEKIIRETDAKELWVLGDLIHHPLGLDQGIVDRITAWMQSQLHSQLEAIRFVPGNHDRSLQQWVHLFPMFIETFGIIREEFQFLHEPQSIEALDKKNSHFSWYGHIHPAISPPMLGSKKLPCFWIQQNQGFLPAFSRLAGGQQIQPFDTDSVYVIADQQVVQIY